MAEWLCSGLQSRLRRFDSGFSLHSFMVNDVSCEICFKIKPKIAMKIPLTKLPITEKDISNVNHVLRSGMLVQGKEVEELEKRVGNLIGSDKVLAVTSGTATMHLALIASGIGPGDEVIVPAFSYIATANVVELVGAKPIFVDININSFNIDVDQIEQAINKKTRAIIPVHEFGMPAEMDKILLLAKKYGLVVIEDGACALGAKFKNKSVGTFGDFGSFSLHPRKSITSGEGGLLVVKNKAKYNLIKSLRNHGITSTKKGPEFSHAGLNYRMTDIQASLVKGQVKRLSSITKKREKVCRTYNQILDLSWITKPPLIANTEPSFQSYHLIIAHDVKRDALIKHLLSKGIQSTYGAQCIPFTKFYATKYNLDKKNYSNAQLAYNKGLVLPLFGSMSTKECKAVFEALKKFKK